MPRRLDGSLCCIRVRIISEQSFTILGVCKLYKLFCVQYFERCSVYFLNDVSISIDVFCAVYTRYRVTFERIPSYNPAISVILFRRHWRIFFPNLFTCSCGLGVCCTWDNSSRLHVLHLYRAYLQFVCCDRVNARIYYVTYYKKNSYVKKNIYIAIY